MWHRPATLPSVFLLALLPLSRASAQLAPPAITGVGVQLSGGGSGTTANVTLQFSHSTSNTSGLTYTGECHVQANGQTVARASGERPCIALRAARSFAPPIQHAALRNARPRSARAALPVTASPVVVPSLPLGLMFNCTVTAASGSAVGAVWATSPPRAVLIGGGSGGGISATVQSVASSAPPPPLPDRRTLPLRFIITLWITPEAFNASSSRFLQVLAQAANSTGSPALAPLVRLNGEAPTKNQMLAVDVTGALQPTMHELLPVPSLALVLVSVVPTNPPTQPPLPQFSTYLPTCRRPLGWHTAWPTTKTSR